MSPEPGQAVGRTRYPGRCPRGRLTPHGPGSGLLQLCSQTGLGERRREGSPKGWALGPPQSPTVVQRGRAGLRGWGWPGPASLASSKGEPGPSPKAREKEASGLGEWLQLQWGTVNEPPTLSSSAVWPEPSGE